MDMIHKDLERKNAQIAAFKQDIEQERTAPASRRTSITPAELDDEGDAKAKEAAARKLVLEEMMARRRQKMLNIEENDYSVCNKQWMEVGYGDCQLYMLSCKQGMASRPQDMVWYRWDMVPYRRDMVHHSQDARSYSPQNPHSWDLDTTRKASPPVNDSKCSRSQKCRKWSWFVPYCTGRRREPFDHNASTSDSTAPEPVASLVETSSESASDDEETIVKGVFEQFSPSSPELFANRAGWCCSH